MLPKYGRGEHTELIVQKLIPHLDRHLAIPLLAHLSDISLFPAEQLARAQYELVKGTNMVDYVQQLQEQIGGDAPGEFSIKGGEVMQEL